MSSVSFKFANIILESNPRSLNFPAMHCRSTAPVIFNHPIGSWELHGPGEFDFTTYFNALSIEKLRRYTLAGKFVLHLEIKGAACQIIQTKAGAFDWKSQEIEEGITSLGESDDWQAVDIELVEPSDAVLLGFLIKSEGSVFLRNGYYATEIVEEDIREVELSLATTTFKKEDFVLENIELVKREIIGSDEPIADHFTMHVVDNGRTLDAEAISSERIFVHPNDNVGGSGGFARGMIESMEQAVPATNVLLMDDDVAVSSESIKRTYNLLCILNDEYKGSFISGAMLDYEIGEDQWEDIGFMTEDGRFAPVKPPLRMTLLHDLVLNEQMKPDDSQKNAYAAWWYCCIPVDTIRREGLPLPVFVRCDDAEYGIRCKPNFISMNGICIWHLSFHTRYNAAVERYQTTRNTMIAQATTGMALESDFIAELHHNIQLELKKFNYTNAELVLDGFEDFMKGPGFIEKPVAEECFMRANRRAEKLLSFEELEQEVAGIEGFDLSALNCIEVDRDRPRSKGEALMDFVTFNGQRTPFASRDAGSVAVIPAAGWMYPAGKICKKEILIAIDPYNKKGVVRRVNIERFKEVMARYKKDMRYYRKNKERIFSEYAAAREKLTSVAFWKEYLGI